MSDIINNEPVDTYQEHEAYHQTYHTDCSSCHRENRLLRAKITVDRNWEEDALAEKLTQQLHGMSRLELAKKLGRVPAGHTGKLCWNTDGLCDDERCYCND